MKFNFKKITSVLASAVLLGSTLGIASAAVYPAPFIQGGNADVSVVTGAASPNGVDLSAAATLAVNLQEELSKQTATTGTDSGDSSSGEVKKLFSDSSKIYVNDSLNKVKTSLTKTDLPTVLAKQSFSGNVDATILQTIEIGSNPSITFAKQPTSSDDPSIGLSLSTNTANYVYNASATFSKAVNLTHTDSEGEEISLFGQKFTIAAATDTESLVLLQSAEKVSLDSDNPTAEVIIGEETYTIELVSSGDTSATIKVTDSLGNANSREISEAASRKISGVTVAVINADETNLKLSATVVVGADKLTFTDGDSVTQGEQNTVIDGTKVTLTGGTGTLTKLVVSVVAADSDSDALKPGDALVDPVFKSFKLDFPGLNVGDDSDAREEIKITSNSDDKMDVNFEAAYGSEAKTITFAKNVSDGDMQLVTDDDYRNITVFEGQIIRDEELVVVGNEDEGRLVKLTSVKNSTTGYDNDYVKFTDVFTGDVYETVFTADGTGTVPIGKDYTVTLAGNSNNATDEYEVRLNYPDSAGQNAIIYPTVKTSKGAKLAFYEPTTITLTAWDGSNTLAGLKFPDGDGFTTATFTLDTGVSDNWNITGAATDVLNLTIATDSVALTIGQLTYNVTGTGNANETTIYLQDVDGANIVQPALIIFEEKDDNNEYQALIVELEPGASGDDGIGVNNVDRTYGTDASAMEATLASDSKKTQEADLWGTIITLDSSDSDQKTATISYPDEQVYAKLYMAEEAATITPGSVSGGSVKPLGNVLYTDAELTADAKAKNLIVVGGSCINTVAAELLGGGLCEGDFTDVTGVGADQFLVQVFNSGYADGKVAMLVAGYEAADTKDAVKYVTTEPNVPTDVETELKKVTSTWTDVTVEATE